MMRKSNVGVFCGEVVAGVLASAGVTAHPAYLGEVPNSGTASCGTCHFNPGGGGARNPFGQAFAAAGHQFTTALCNADSDGDGYVNGVELADANCDGAPEARTAVSRPGESGSTPCGNGTIEGPEVCDGAQLGGRSCADEGFTGGGALRCDASCKLFDTSGCMQAGDPDMGEEPDMAPGPDMAPDPDMAMMADMAPDVDMDAAPDMTMMVDMALGEDMAAPDMGSSSDQDMASGSDMSGVDMSSEDMGSGMVSAGGGGGGDDDEGCAQVGLSTRTAGAPMSLLGLLGLAGLIRRRRK
jgi:hypothetical protein